MLPGQVGKVRELQRGVEAQVCVGVSKKFGWAIVTVTSHSPEVEAAMQRLRDALRDEADVMIREAQADRNRRGKRAIGT